MKNLKDLKKHDFQFSKRFGQNFIFDQQLLQAITRDAQVNQHSVVLEIGAGSGSLTKALSKAAKRVISYEIDASLKPVLAETLANCQNVSLVFGDIMKTNTADLEAQIGEPYLLVANLPYYITTPILFKFLKETSLLQSMTVMVQKEVAQRIVARPNTSDYGIMSVILQAATTPTITRQVNKTMFTPAPKVDSALVHFEINKQKHNITDYTFFENLVKQSFSMRRKTLVNNLKNYNNATSQALITILEQMGLNENVRAENLSVENFITLAHQLQQ